MMCNRNTRVVHSQDMLIRGAHVYTPGRDLGFVSVRIDDGIIREVSPALGVERVRIVPRQ